MNSQNITSTKIDVYQLVTDQIIALLEQGVIPWQKPWADSGIPMNLLSKRQYRGINLWLLLSLNYEKIAFSLGSKLRVLVVQLSKANMDILLYSGNRFKKK